MRRTSMHWTRPPVRWASSRTRWLANRNCRTPPKTFHPVQGYRSMKKIQTILCALLLLAGAPWAIAATGGDDAAKAGATASSGNLLFILDASGSMWGRVDGKPKIVVAKEVMSRLVRELPDDARAGLTAYGHRRKGDCMDIESLVALGPLDRDAMIRQIEGLNAKGMTPLTASVKQAIEQLRQAEQSASVVLVS